MPVTMKNNPLTIPFILLFLCFSIRIYAALMPGIIVPDGMLYINTAKLISAGEWQKVSEYGFYSTYPFLVLFFQKVFSDWETAGRMVSVFFGSLAVLPLYLLIKRMFDVRTAVVTSVFFIISPRLVEYSSNVLREPVFWCFSITALWIAWKGIVQKNWFFIVCAGFFVGLSSLTRMEGIALAGIVILWMVWVLLFKEKDGKRFFLLLVVFLVSFPILFSPPLNLLKNRTGKWEIGLVGTKVPALLTSDNNGTEANANLKALEPGKTGSFFQNAVNNRYVSSFSEVAFKFFRSFHVVMIFLLLLGIFMRKAIPYSQREVPLLIWFSVVLLISFFYVFKTNYLSTRHGLLMGVPSLLWVSIGFLELNDRVEKFIHKKKPLWGSLRYFPICFLIIISMIILPKTLSSSGYDKIEMKKAGLILKSKGYSREKFAVQSKINRLVFYTGAEFVNIPSDLDHLALERFLGSIDAGFLVVDERTIDDSVTGFRSNITAMNLERLYLPELEGYKEYSFALFRVRK